jgi:putative RecB family exonuclease
METNSSAPHLPLVTDGTSVEVAVPRRDPATTLALSPSTMMRFQACELAWVLKNVGRFPGATPGLRVTIGDMFHVVAAEVGRLAPDARSLDAARRITQQEIMKVSRSETWQELGYGLDEEMDLGLKVWNLIESWFELEPVAELPIVAVESLVESVVAGFAVRGVIDRADRLDDGRLVVVDYKTGRAPRPSERESRLFGVQVYGLALETMGYPVAELQLVYVGSGDIVKVAWTESLAAATLASVETLAAQMSEVLKDGRATAVSGKHCLGCPYTLVCPAQGHTPPSEADLTGKTPEGAERPLGGPESGAGGSDDAQHLDIPLRALRGEIPVFCLPE